MNKVASNKAASREALGTAVDDAGVRGEFVDFAGERYYAIYDVDRMAPFFISVISHDDHWLFASSTGGLTAGRVSPDSALFPYVPVDQIHDGAPHTGSKTLLRFRRGGAVSCWEPFNRAHDGRHPVRRNLYKNLLGNKLCFEEINEELGLAFRYTWTSSSEYGFVRRAELENLGNGNLRVGLVDGLRNVLPAGTPLHSQTNASNLVDAYKWNELDESTGLALLTLYSGITDRAEPCESLKATTVFQLGLDGGRVLLSADQLDDFRRGKALHQEPLKRGVRGAYLVNHALELAPGKPRSWTIVANLEQSQRDAVALRRQLRDPAALGAAIERSVAAGCDELARIVATGDAFQATAEEVVAVHHYANVLFNILRGGVFDDQYRVPARDLWATIRNSNQEVYRRNATLLKGLPGTLEFGALRAIAEGAGDCQLTRLCNEYLPITFGRRHGDPSRPWNQFAIRLKDQNGDRLLSYQGNWRDIFQNWEALGFSYPGFVDNLIAKFVNASTVDGYNPYRITKEGIDWEVEEPDNPWSYIGYWGDHQIIYLLKLLELCRRFHPVRLAELLREAIYSYANVPYRIKPFEALLADPKNTVEYDQALAERIERRVARIGADGKLLLAAEDQVYQVNLLEKLLVPLLAKLGNLVIDGGIWLNTQRPEWNDANNALVGHGLSMVTLYYMRRYIRFLQELLAAESESFALSHEVAIWAKETAAALRGVRPLLGGGPIDPRRRHDALVELGRAAERYRAEVYRREGFSGTNEQPIQLVVRLLDDALATVDHSIATNRREDGLYHAYNVLDRRPSALGIDALYPMLEGQVAALSSGALTPEQAIEVVEALFASDIYRADLQSFMLYPDRKLPRFLERNRIEPAAIESIPLLERMLAAGDERIVVRDGDGYIRFSAEFTNAGDLNTELDRLTGDCGDEIATAREAIAALYERVFRHRAFTGRSGTMFAFEGLGSVYWHMVSKLLLAVQENFFSALDDAGDPATIRRLGELYYRVRAGLGFNKTPPQYGAFPTDPYSHTPKHAGAQQPGMTGLVKEEILTRFGELGVRVDSGVVRFQPALLRASEFVAEARAFRYLDVGGDWHDLAVPSGGLAFTWCQVPVVYRLDPGAEANLTVVLADGERRTAAELKLPAELSAELFGRTGRIRELRLTLRAHLLFSD